MFTFTDEQVATLTPIINQALGLFVIDKATPGIFTEAYGAVLNAISQFDAPDPMTGAPGIIPADGIPENVWRWVQGAQAVNQNGSGFPGFIRTYTRVQKELRTGEILSDDEIQAASNGVAANFLTELLGRLETDRQMLDIHKIGEQDAGAAASKVFGGDYAPWAGTLLFPYLGESSFFRDLLLTNDVFDNGVDKIANSEPGTYDLIASLQSSFVAATSNWVGLVNEFLKGNVPSTDVSSLTGETNTYFANSYGLAPNTQFKPGDDLLFNSVAAFFPNISYYVGQTGDDTGENALNLTIDSQVVIANAGRGNDEITFTPFGLGAVTHYALIDGGLGIDSISYQGAFSNVLTGEGPIGLSVNFEQNSGSLYDFSIEISGDSLQHSLFGIEAVTLGNGDDTLTIGPEGVPQSLDGLTIDAGLSLEKGDLLDGSGLNAGIMVALQGADDGNGGFAPGSITVGTETLTLANFDNVIGTAQADGITGSGGRDDIHGGGDSLPVFRCAA